MKRIAWILPAILVCAAGGYSIAQDKKPAEKPAQEKQEKKEEPVVTLKGQVIDFACYFANNVTGGDHQQCAETCLKNGATAGFKTKDKTYVVIRDPMHQKDAADLTKFANKDAEVTANVFTRDGVQGIKILTIK